MIVELVANIGIIILNIYVIFKINPYTVNPIHSTKNKIRKMAFPVLAKR